MLGGLEAPSAFAEWWKEMASREGGAIVLRDIESGDVVERSNATGGETYGPIHVPKHDYRVFYGEFGG